ncbi:MAG: hypothetical protein U1E23_09470 [Reyranellaceae bacterium]
MSSSLASHLVTQRSSLFGADGQFDGVGLAPFQIRAGVPRETLARDLDAVIVSLLPGPRQQIAHEVAKLMIRTKARVHGDGEAKLLAETMVDDLSRYPLDVVRFACQYWIEGGRDARFFPSWPELREICEKRMDGRIRLKRALEWAIGDAA